MNFVREKSVKSQGISFQTKSGHPDNGLEPCKVCPIFPWAQPVLNI